ncbi:prepilin peptidase [Amnibacterium flavum]|uniref:Prepilin leader peptidase/N-methyltransferase n=1 Tax=Amnibacterium flavum TaxID=2173173 RepID=A0A2V1HR98_9MICO|nr:A24 family peptidase [Amnibacterium flavum]PVZ95146.1 prepilin peptidase [Amnibacterium flavum]
MIAAVIGIFGGLIGSFLNVVIYRVPRGLSVVNPPSACPGCGEFIHKRDNIPVVSWLLLRGRCRNCRTAISARYPLVELGTALFFALVALRFVPALIASDGLAGIVAGLLALVALLYLAGSSVALALIDLDVRRLPNAIVLPLFIVGAVLLTTSSVITGDGEALLRAGIGTLVLGGVYLALALAVPGGMGMGDVKLAAVLGLYLAWLGWPQLAVGAIAAFLLGGLFGVVLLLTRRARRGSSVPFGPWMLLGAWIGIFAGEPLASSYLSLLGL